MLTAGFIEFARFQLTLNALDISNAALPQRAPFSLLKLGPWRRLIPAARCPAAGHQYQWTRQRHVYVHSCSQYRKEFKFRLAEHARNVKHTGAALEHFVPEDGRHQG
jgi:hypothetical protein